MALTSGLTLTCTDGFAAGLKALYLIDKADVAFTLASGSTDTYDTVTLDSGKIWYQFEFEEDLAEFRETVEGERGSYKVTQEVEFFVKGLSATKRGDLQSLLDNSPCGFVAAVKDNNDVVWILGYNESFKLGERPVRVKSDTTTTLKALGEVAGSTIVLNCITKVKALTCTGTIDITP